MKLPSSTHTSQPWRIHDLAPDFRLEDVWALPGSDPDDFERLVQLIASFDPSGSSHPVVRALFAVRWSLGRLLGWDTTSTGTASRVTSLRERLPADLRDGAPGPDFSAAPFTPLYLTDDEFAAESANATMHGVLHLGRVADGTGGYRTQMAIMVKPNGVLGAAYMAAIRPFRYLIVYPVLLRQLEGALRRAQPAPT